MRCGKRETISRDWVAAANRPCSATEPAHISLLLAAMDAWVCATSDFSCAMTSATLSRPSSKPRVASSTTALRLFLIHSKVSGAVRALFFGSSPSVPLAAAMWLRTKSTVVTETRSLRPTRSSRSRRTRWRSVSTSASRASASSRVGAPPPLRAGTQYSPAGMGPNSASYCSHSPSNASCMRRRISAVSASASPVG